MHVLRKSIMAGALLAASALGPSSAIAATIINADGSVTFDSEGDAVNIRYNGLGGDPNALTLGLSADLTLTLLSIAANTFTFSYSLVNTSTVDDTRITGLGFNVDPDVTSISSTGVFDRFSLNTNFASQGLSETCFNGGPGDCPQSNPNNSIGFEGTGSGTFAFTFGGPQSSITLSDFLNRYQGFQTTNVNGSLVTSAVGIGTPSMVPEPAVWAMMLLGFGGIGSAMRRKKLKPAVQFA